MERVWLNVWQLTNSHHFNERLCKGLGFSTSVSILIGERVSWISYVLTMDSSMLSMERSVWTLSKSLFSVSCKRFWNSITELRRFLGIINYYRRWVKHAAHHLEPLYDTTVKGEPKPQNLNLRFKWGPAMKSSLEAIFGGSGRGNTPSSSTPS